MEEGNYFSQKDVPDAMFDRGTSACEATAELHVVRPENCMNVLLKIQIYLAMLVSFNH